MYYVAHSVCLCLSVCQSFYLALPVYLCLCLPRLCLPLSISVGLCLCVCVTLFAFFFFTDIVGTNFRIMFVCFTFVKCACFVLYLYSTCVRFALEFK